MHNDNVPVRHLTSNQYFPDGLPVSVYYSTGFTGFPYHTHDFSEIIIVLRGEGQHLVDLNEHYVCAGDVFAVHGNMPHGYDKLRNFDHINLIYKPNEIELPAGILSMPGYHAFFEIEPRVAMREPYQQRLHLTAIQLNELSQLVDRLSGELAAKSSCFAEMSMNYFQQIVIFISRIYGQQKTPLSDCYLKLGKVISLLEQDYARQWTIDKLAREVNMSRRTLTRQFNDVVGYPVISYLAGIRMQQAMKLIINTDLSITDIALQVGFYDSNYMCKLFRRIHGTTPHKYRVSNRK